jgi:hypothetical protein
MAVALVIAYNIAMVNRQSGKQSSDRSPKKKKPKRLGLYKEGKTMIEKVVKETFKPDSDDGEVKKDDKVIEKVIEEESGGGVFVPIEYESNVDTSDLDERGSIQYPKVIEKNKKEK